jgi:hypothetical protein
MGGYTMTDRDNMRNEEIVEEVGRDAYLRGFLDGIREYAWWKDGVQYVGSCGTTLKDAIATAKRDKELGKLIYEYLCKQAGKLFEDVSCDEDYRTMHVEVSSAEIIKTTVRSDTQ